MGKSTAFKPTLGYFLPIWGAFRGAFILLIGCSGNAQFFGMVGLCWDVLCSLCSLGGGSCRTKGMRVRVSMAGAGWHG